MKKCRHVTSNINSFESKLFLKNIMRPSDGSKRKTPRHDNMALWLLDDKNQQLVANKILRSKSHYYERYFDEMDKLTVRSKGGLVTSRMLQCDILKLEFEVVSSYGDCDAIMVFRPHTYHKDNEVLVAIIEFKPEIRSATGTISQIKKYMKHFRSEIVDMCRGWIIDSIDGIIITHDPNSKIDPLFKKEGIHIYRELEFQQTFFSE